MLEEVARGATQLLGIGEDDLTAWHMVARAVVVYFVALVIIRAGEKRFLGKNTAFDVILGVVLGSMVSRSITNTDSMIGILSATAVLVAMHWGISKLTFRSDWLGNVMKGDDRVLVHDGEVDWNAMRRSAMSKDDLLSALRSQAHVEHWSDVKEARLERSGDVSVIKKDSDPQVLSAKIDGSELHLVIKLG